MRFSSKQVTAMVVAGCAAVILAPTIAVASGVGLVSITDPVHATQKARVFSGRLATTTNGAVTVGGVIANRDQLPLSPWSTYGSATNDGVSEVDFTATPTTHAVGISSLVVSASGSDPVIVRVRAITPSGSTCAAGGTIRNETMKFNVPSGQTIAIPFATPLTVRPLSGHKLCVFAFVDTSSAPSAAITVSASGFTQ